MNKEKYLIGIGICIDPEICNLTWGYTFNKAYKLYKASGLDCCMSHNDHGEYGCYLRSRFKILRNELARVLYG